MSALPTEAFESLLPSLLEIFALVEHSSEVPADKVVQHKHAIAQATLTFKERMKKARELIEGLPGGEMLPTDQDEVIKFLEEVKQQKRDQISQFLKLSGSR